MKRIALDKAIKGVKMKNTKSIIAIILVVVMLFSLTACGSKLPAIQKAFETEGYELQESSIGSAIFNSIIEAANKATQEEGKEPTVKVYEFSKSLFKSGVVLEFKNTSDLKKFYDDSSNTIKGLIKDVAESDFMNSNCILISLDSDMYDIFKKA